MSFLSRTSRTFARALVPAVLFAACVEHTPAVTAPHPSAPRLSTAVSAGGVVISQVYGGGGNSGAPYSHDFVELYNAGGSAVSLAGWSVQYASATGTTWLNRVDLGGSIEPGGYYLIQMAAGTTLPTPPALPTPDATGSVNMSGTAGKVALVNTTTALTQSGCTGTPGAFVFPASVVDFVGYGTTATCYEGVGPAPAPSNTTADIRAGGGTTDTDNNRTDFATGTPTPRNGASGPVTVRSTLPANLATDVSLGSSITLTFSKPVTLTDPWFGISCTKSGAVAATATLNGTTATLDPDADLQGKETCTVTVSASGVTDQSVPPVPMASDHQFTFTTVDGNVCEQPFTPAFTIQGSGAATPLASQKVITQGVVVGDYEGASPAVRGFYIQDAAGDGDPATSDGLFVFNGGADQVKLGDVVRVSGRSVEFQNQTQLDQVTSVITCSTGAVASPADVTLPATSSDYLERFEGMLVRLPQTLTVTEHFQLGRFGQVTLSANGRLPQPTSVAAPGPAALAVQQSNDLNRIIVDDGDNSENPDPILFGGGDDPLSAANTLRGGDVVTGVVGVMTYAWAGNSASGNAYRVRPLNALGGSAPVFVAANPRPTAPPAVGGTLKVVAMNLLNYFNSFSGCGFGLTGGVADCRGADDVAEFNRQWPKTVAAIRALDPDILGVNEIENDGYVPTSAIAHLVDKLNIEFGAGTYAYVDFDAATGQTDALGTDAIKVGVIYKPAKVSPVGTTAVLNSAAFVNGGDPAPRNRATFAQAFAQPNRARFVLTVNHLKSKGSACSAPDAGDGQGNCAVVRTNAANVLAGWLASDPTGTGESDVLILGDLNSYAQEAPITALRDAGYTNLVETRLGAGAYSYAFDGQWGYLDHALGSASIVGQVTGVGEYHINADEPSILDYNTNFKSLSQQTLLYAADQFRVSDHDPVVVGLNLVAPPPPLVITGFFAPVDNAPIVNVVKAGSGIPIKFSLGGDKGLGIFAIGFPASRAVACAAGSTANDIGLDETVSAGQSGLTYDASTDLYTYVWRTEKSWVGGTGCRELVVRLSDGTQKTAIFQFTR